MNDLDKPVVVIVPGDLHLTDPGLENVRAARWVVNQANALIRPDFVQYIGDNVQDATEDQWQLFNDIRGRLEVPQEHVILLDNGRSLRAVDFGLFEQTGKCARGGFNHSHGAVLEADRRDAGILDLDPFVGEGAGETGDFRDVPHEPLQQIDIMNRLIHVSSAAVELPSAAPSAAVVILLCAPPLDVRIPQSEPAESPFVDRRFEHLAGRAEPRRKDFSGRTARLR